MPVREIITRVFSLVNGIVVRKMGLNSLGLELVWEFVVNAVRI